ncbi:MAG: thiamine pyrophosphate-binding protein [Chloroflexota bacterium]
MTWVVRGDIADLLDILENSEFNTRENEPLSLKEHLDYIQNVNREKLTAHVNRWKNAENLSWQTIDHEIETAAYFDGGVVYDVVDLIPDESTLFVGNSLPVRHLDQFGKPQQKRIYTYANRGASGIDGNISTALGAGVARPDKPLVAIFGDITFYHDMNGLLAVHRCGVPITIVLINNDGGGIFNRLPIRDYDPEFTEYFITPHGLDFSHSAKLYGLDYVQIDAREGQREARTQFREVFSAVVGTQQSTIIEVRTDSKFDEARRQEIVQAVHERIKVLSNEF